MATHLPEERLRKLEALRAAGVDPYPKRFPARGETRNWIGPLRESYVDGAEVPAIVCGRVTAYRDHGKSIFFDVKDETGKVQVYVQQDKVGEAVFTRIRNTFDLNDHVGVRGTFAKTRRGELTVFATRRRDAREVDDAAARQVARLARQGTAFGAVATSNLNANDEVMAQFRMRSRIVAEMRKFLDQRGFIEVETPVLHHIAGGAAARPFLTHHNALDLDLSLRIALELHLKRLLVGGMEKVFEIGRVFRNEGIDTRHNPEFTMIELYWAYADYEDVMDLWEQLLVHLAMTARGTTKLTWGGTSIDLSAPFRRVRYEDLLKQHAGVDLDDEAAVRAKCAAVGIDTKEKSHHKAANDLFEMFCERTLIQPTFVIDYPRGITTLAKWKDFGGDRAERFELFVNGLEIANAFSEMNDPIAQRQILEKQVLEKDPENPAAVDEDFLERARIRHAARGWRRHGRRPSGDAVDGRGQHP
jgi:lysyl-tRNA synthetase class 2